MLLDPLHAKLHAKLHAQILLHAPLHANYMLNYMLNYMPLHAAQSYYLFHYMPIPCSITWFITCHYIQHHPITCSITCQLHAQLHDSLHTQLPTITCIAWHEPMITCFLEDSRRRLRRLMRGLLERILFSCPEHENTGLESVWIIKYSLTWTGACDMLCH